MRATVVDPQLERFLAFVEWAQVCESIAARTGSSSGGFRARDLAPATDPEVVRLRLERTAEARALLDAGALADLDLSQITDVEAMFRRAQRLGRGLEARQLHGLATTLLAAEEARRVFAGSPGLLALVAAPPGDGPLEEVARADGALARELLAKIGDYGVLLDEASEALERIRDELRAARAGLVAALTMLCSEPTFLQALAEFKPVDKDGIQCLLVKASAIRRVDGPILGEHKTGALYVEPDKARDHYNRVRHLELDEKAEVARIVKQLAALAAPRRAAYERLGDGLIEADVHLALARWSRHLGLVRPQLGPRLELELRGARHPLLIGASVASSASSADGAAPAAREQEEEREAPRPCVPIDVALGERRVLVISGPNGGGKTVAMKTVGLLAALAQSGSFIPALEGSRLPVFGAFLAVADARSSVAAGLSHFQAHARELAEVVQALRPGALLLLDEIGHGTDPGEAAALAQAFIEHALARGDVLTMATTHLGPLKAFAQRTPGAMNAAVDLDAEGRPTFVLVAGRAGGSFALGVARAAGLPESICARAEALHGGAS